MNPISTISRTLPDLLAQTIGFARGSGLENAFKLLLLLFFSAFSQAAYAARQGTDGALDLNPYLQYVVDPSGQLDLQQLRGNQQMRWQQTPASGASFGYTSDTYWFRLTLRNSGSQPQERLLELAYPVLDHADIYQYSNGSFTRHWAVGDKFPFGSRPFWHRNFVVPFTLAPNGQSELWIRVRTDSAMQVPLALWTRDALEKRDQRNNLLYGIYYGIMISMLLYNLMLYIGTRSRSYLLYVLWVSSIASFLATLNGTSFQYFWPDATRWNDESMVLFLAASHIFGAQFCISFLKLEVHFKRMATTIRLLSGASALVILLLPWLPYPIAIRWTMLNVIASILIIAPASGRLWRMGFRPARYLVIAWTFLLLSAVALALNKMGFIPRNLWTENALQVGSLIEVLMLSLALADNFNEQRRQRDVARMEALRAQRRMLLMQQRQNEQLEQRVAERTEALADANAVLRQYLARMSRMQTSSELGHNVVHELRQPLTAILSFSQAGLTIMKNVANPAGKIGQVLEHIRDTVRQANLVIDRLRNYIGQNQQQLAWFDLNDSIRDGVGWIRPNCVAAGIRLQESLQPELPPVYGDQVLLQQVVVNLLKNAYEALLNEELPSACIQIESFQSPDGHVCCRICDNGPGINAEVAAHLFDPFFTTKAGGMGLGMKISRAILEDIGGSLTLEPATTGARLLLCLPIAPPPALLAHIND